MICFLKLLTNQRKYLHFMLFNLLFGNEQSIAAENKQHKVNKKGICCMI